MPRSRNPARVANRHTVPVELAQRGDRPRGQDRVDVGASGTRRGVPPAAMATKPCTSGRVSVALNSRSDLRRVRARPRPARRGRARTGGRARRRTPPPARPVSARRPRRCGRRPRRRRGVHARAASSTLRPSLGAHQVRVGAGGAETLVVGRGDHVAAREEVGDVRHGARRRRPHATARRCRRARSCRAPSSSPARPPGGAGPVGATTSPDSATSRPSSAREWYRMRHARAPAGAPIGSARISVPGAAAGSGDGGASTSSAATAAESATAAAARRPSRSPSRSPSPSPAPAPVHGGTRRRGFVRASGRGVHVLRCAPHLVAGALEHASAAAPGSRLAAASVATVGALLGVGGEVVQLPLRVDRRSARTGRPGRRALLPLGEPVVVVVELPELGRAVVARGQAGDHRLDLGRLAHRLERLAGEQVGRCAGPG